MPQHLATMFDVPRRQLAKAAETLDGTQAIEQRQAAPTMTLVKP